MKITEKRKDTPVQEGDLIALYGDETNKFRLLISLDEKRAVLIYDLAKGVVGNIISTINNVCKEEISLGTLRLPNEIDLTTLEKDSYEIYNFNIYTTPKLFEKTFTDFFEVLKKNLIEIQRLIEGDIVTMHGLKFMDKFAIYHHHAIYSDAKKCKVIHKWGELNKIEIVRNLLGETFDNIGVREDNLIEVAIFREIQVNNCYDEKYKNEIRSSDQIVADARKRIGEMGYDLITDNCQHFCTECRYGIPVAIEIETGKQIAAATVAGVSLIASAVGAYAAYRASKNKQKVTQ